MALTNTSYSELSVSIVIPTYNRGELLIETLNMLLDQRVEADQILVMDQTVYPDESEIKNRLSELSTSSKIGWSQLPQPSIPKAMNAGLSAASSKWVLFLDDDIHVEPNFIGALKEVLSKNDYLGFVGQVVQPWQKPNRGKVAQNRGTGIRKDLGFVFNSSQEAELVNCMAGNLCVNREAAILAGGFDENFSGAAYRFETEFSRRFCEFHNTKLLYSPHFMIDHLHASRGGTRTHAGFLTSSSPRHSEGDYYYALIRGNGFERLAYCLRRMFGSLVAKFYLMKPWYMPVRLTAEFRGLISAYRLKNKGQALIAINR